MEHTVRRSVMFSILLGLLTVATTYRYTYRYRVIDITTDSGTIQTITENGVERNVMRVDSGATISLVCTLPDDDVTGLAGIAIWASPGTVLYFDETPAHTNAKFSLEKKRVGTTTQYILTMSDLSLDEEGEYKCQDLNDNELPLWIMVSTAPNITFITPMQTAVVGQDVKLKCIAIGNPDPKIRWRHTRPNTRLPNGIEGTYKKGINFDIDYITLEDRGEYECIASNGIPNDKFKPSKTTFIKMEYQPVVSALTDNNADLKVPSGESAELKCKAEAHPRASPSDVNWFKDDVAISDMDGYTVKNVHQIAEEIPDPYNETTYSTLRIVEVNSNTTGNYKCQFKNSKGTNSATIALQIGEPVSKCQRLVEEADSLSGQYIPQCSTTGEFTPVQCHVDDCWCVNSSGEEIPGTRRGPGEGTPDCPTVSKCQRLVEETDTFSGQYIPQCSTTGEFAPVQCYGDDCWCVNVNGEEVNGTRRGPGEGTLHCLTDVPLTDILNSSVAEEPGPEPEPLGPPLGQRGECPALEGAGGGFGNCSFLCEFDGDCGAAEKCCPTACGGMGCVEAIHVKPPGPELTTCLIRVQEAGQHLPGKYIPQCTEAGDFHQIQCHESIGECWLVNENGTEMEGTRRGVFVCEKKKE